MGHSSSTDPKGYDGAMTYRLLRKAAGGEPHSPLRWRAKTRHRQLRRRSVAVLPALFTLGNLLCGFLAIFFASRNSRADLPWHWTPLTLAALFVFMGMLFDALDGRVARLTRQSSDLGEQLDSMADMVTFGAAPAFLAVQLAGIRLPFFSDAGDAAFDRIALVIAGIYVACTALRLTRFNIEKVSGHSRDPLSFKGMPSPGAAGTVVSFVLLHQHFLAKRAADHWSVSAAAISMVALTLLVAVAMVSRMRYPHIANRYFTGKARFNTIVKIVVIAPFLVIWPQAWLATGFALYALSGPTQWLWRLTVRSRRPIPIPPPHAE